MRRAFLIGALVLIAPLANAQTSWPLSARGDFMRSCTGLKQDLVPHCACIIDNLAREISYAEFGELAKAGTIASDARYVRIRSSCLATPRSR